MKAYTDLSQSKKLAEILLFKSADMKWYNPANDDSEFTEDVSLIKNNSEYYLFDKVTDWNGAPYVPCWSLAALLDVLPFHLIVNNQRYAFSMRKGLDKNGETYAIKYAIFNTTFYLHLTDFYNNPVDACVDMILKLKEKNLI